MLEQHYKVSATTMEAMSLLLKRPWDPVASTMAAHKHVSIVVVYNPVFNVGSCQRSL